MRYQLRSPLSVQPTVDSCMQLRWKCGTIPCTIAGAFSAWTPGLSCLSYLFYHCTRSLEHACILHVILVSARGSEMRTRREGASGRRMSQASQDSSGHFLSTRADLVIRSKRVGSHYELAFPNVCRTAVRYITSNITSHHLTTCHCSHVSYSHA